MPKKKRARKSAPSKKSQTAKEDEEFKWALRATVCGDFLRRGEFMEALKTSGLVQLAAEAYRKRQIFETAHLVELGLWSQERLDTTLNKAVTQFKEKLPEALYAGALIIATQTSAAIVRREPMDKNFIRGITNWLFITRSEREFLADGRGRKTKIEASDVFEAIYKRGRDASRKGVAFDLGVSETAINDWRISRQYPSWKAAVANVFEVWK